MLPFFKVVKTMIKYSEIISFLSVNQYGFRACLNIETSLLEFVAMVSDEINKDKHDSGHFFFI